MKGWKHGKGKYTCIVDVTIEIIQQGTGCCSIYAYVLTECTCGIGLEVGWFWVGIRVDKILILGRAALV